MPTKDGKHGCYPCYTTYHSVEQRVTLEPGETLKDPVVQYQIWRWSGACDACAREWSNYDGPMPKL